MVAIITVGGDQEQVRTSQGSSVVGAGGVLSIYDGSTKEATDVLVTVKGNGNALITLQSSEAGAAFADVADPVTLAPVNATVRAVMRIYASKLKLQWKNNDGVNPLASADVEVEGFAIPVA